MSKNIDKLYEIYPDKVINNLSKNYELYYNIMNEANVRHKSVKEYLYSFGFTYGSDATIIKLEREVEEGLKELATNKINASLLNEVHLYTNVCRLANAYGTSIKEYIENLDYTYERNSSNDSTIDYYSVKRMKEEFSFTYVELGDIVGVSKQRIEQIITRGKANSKKWVTDDLSSVEDVFESMLKNHVFEMRFNEMRYFIKHNEKKEMCFLWYDEITPHCAFAENITLELMDVVQRERMDELYAEDFEVLESVHIVNKLKKPCIKPLDYAMFEKARKKHRMDKEEYSIFLGFEGYVSNKDVNIDKRIIDFFEDNLIDGEVYISSSSDNQWIKSFANRNHMGIKEFVEFYGYRKAARGKFAELEGHLADEREKLRKELEGIAQNRDEVQPQGKLYQRLYIFAQKNHISIDKLIEELGFQRIRLRRESTSVKNELDELNKEIENARKYEKSFAESEEKQILRKKRNMSLVSRLKEIYSYKCQLCSKEEWLQIRKGDGTYYVEVHHIKPLAEEKNENYNEEEILDRLENMIVVCPNHHKFLHFHNGGFRDIVEEQGVLYFVNENMQKIEIITNYHLKKNI